MYKRGTRLASNRQKEQLLSRGLLQEEDVNSMSYEDARHILDISNTSNEVKRANELARSFKVGDKVFYYGELCEVAAVRELRPRKVDCNMSNISIMMPSGKKKAVTAKMLTKAE